MAKFTCQPMTKFLFPIIPLSSDNVHFEQTSLFLLTVSLDFVIHATIPYMCLPLAKRGPTYNKMTFKITRNGVRFSLNFKKVLQPSDTSFESYVCDKYVSRYNNSRFKILRSLVLDVFYFEV